MNHPQQEHRPEARAASDHATADAGANHRVRADIKAYLDGELPGLQRWLTARHLTRCAACRAETRRLQQLGQQMQRLDQATPDPRLRARILASLPAAPAIAHASPTAPRFRFADARDFVGQTRRLSGAMAGLCVLLLAVGASALGWYVQRSGKALPKTFAAANSDKAFSSVSVSSVPSVVPADAILSGSGGPASSGRAQGVAAIRPSAPVPTPAQSDPFAPGAVAQPSAASPAVPAPASDIADRADGSALPVPSVTPGYTDPTSAEAERLAGTVIPDKLRVRRELTAMSPVPARVKAVSFKGKTAVLVSAQLSVAVADVSEASRQVKKWAEQEGAIVTVLAYRAADTAPKGGRVRNARGEAGPDGFTAHAEPSDEAAAAALAPSQTPALLSVKIPVQRAGSLKTYLGQVGTPLTVTAGGTGKGVPRVRSLEADVLTPRPYRMAAPMFEAEPATRPDRRAMVTIVVRLQSDISTPRP